jgi:hypothetical protein
MIPELMPEIFHVLEMGVQESHEFYDGIGISLSSFRVFDRHDMIDHFLYVTSVFPHDKLVAGRIVFHNDFGNEGQMYVKAIKYHNAGLKNNDALT